MHSAGVRASVVVFFAVTVLSVAAAGSILTSLFHVASPDVALTGHEIISL